MLNRTIALSVVCAMPLAIALPTVSLAASVDGVEGVVLVNRGKGFVPAIAPLDLKAGDKIMAKPGGSALLVYGPTCVVPIRAGTVVAVAAASPCPPTTAANWKVDVSTQVTESAAATPPADGIAPLPSDAVPTDVVDAPPVDGEVVEAPSSSWSTGEIVVGGLVVGGGVAAAAVLASKKSSSSPASP